MFQQNKATNGLLRFARGCKNCKASINIKFIKNLRARSKINIFIFQERGSSRFKIFGDCKKDINNVYFREGTQEQIDIQQIKDYSYALVVQVGKSVFVIFLTLYKIYMGFGLISCNLS